MAGFSQSEAVLHQGDGGDPTEVFAAIAQVLSMTPPSETVQTTKRYVFGSANPLVFTGRPEDQTLTFELALDRGLTGHAAIEDAVGGATAVNYRLIWPDGYRWSFAAKVTGFEPGEMSADSSDPFTASVTLTLTTAITRALNT